MSEQERRLFWIRLARYILEHHGGHFREVKYFPLAY